MYVSVCEHVCEMCMTGISVCVCVCTDMPMCKLVNNCLRDKCIKLAMEYLP